MAGTVSGFGRRGALALAAGMTLAGGARAQGAWPDRQTRLIVPFGAGGAIDTLSRTVANAFPGVDRHTD